MGPNTAPADEGKDLGLDKMKDRNKEKVESSGEEDEDGSPNELNFKKDNKSTYEQQKTYSKTRPEKATNMEANTVPPSDGVSGLQKHVEKFHATRATELKHTKELENVEKTNKKKSVEDLENDKTEEDDTNNSEAGNKMEEGENKDTKNDMESSNELAESLEKDADVAGGDSKSSNPLNSDFALSSQPTLADISKGVDIMKNNAKLVQLEECMKDDWEFNDLGVEVLEE